LWSVFVAFWALHAESRNLRWERRRIATTRQKWGEKQWKILIN
jgi:hypothetical protein